MAREREIVKGGVGRMYQAREKAGPTSEIRKSHGEVKGRCFDSPQSLREECIKEVKRTF